MSVSNVAKTATDGIAQHPKYFNAKIEPGMKLPADTRLLRDIKLYEVPGWLLKRNWTPLGLWFSAKRLRHRYFTKYLYVRRPGGIFIAQFSALLCIAMYCNEHKYIKLHRARKYH